MSMEYGGAGMQISRHWRLSGQRYMLKGSRDEKGVFSVQPIAPQILPSGQGLLHSVDEHLRSIKRSEVLVYSAAAAD